jgi:hypothetical protein
MPDFCFSGIGVREVAKQYGRDEIAEKNQNKLDRLKSYCGSLLN